MTNDKWQILNNPPQGPMMPPQMGPARPRGWRDRWMHRFGMDALMPLQRGALTIPAWITGKSIAFFFVAMFACWLFFGYVPEMNLWLAACVSIVLFFYGGDAMAKSWAKSKPKSFARRIYIAGLVARLAWVLYCVCFFNPDHYGNTFGDEADTSWYMPYGMAIADWIKNGFNKSFSELMDEWASGMDDTGYPMWLGIGYVIWGEWSDAVMPMIVKCIVGAYCAVCIYHVAQRHFGEGAARMAAIFVALNPNMIYWCGNMFKEAEMLFFVCLAVDNLDRVLTSGNKFTFKTLLPGILSALALMFFRTALGLVMFMAVFAHVVMASQRVMSMGKKIIAGLLVFAALAISMGEQIRVQSEHLISTAQSDAVQKEIELRGTYKNASGRSQSFAKYATSAIFAPLIFTIPFPTFNVAHEGQLLHIQLSGGNYIKNILSFFVLIVMIMMLISGEWRRHVFILAYTLGYLVVLVMSAFAQSGRFHMPIWPMLMLFAAYGIQIAKTNARVRKWFPIVLVIEVVACIAWNWFKLKGRGMI